MKIIKWYLLLFLILGRTVVVKADTQIDGSALTDSSFTITGLVSISTLTATSISVSTVTAGDGGVSKPSYSFTSSQNSGHYFATNEVDLAVTGSQVARWTSAGEIIQPLQPSFLVTNSSGPLNVTGDGTTYTVPWPNEITDQNGDFSSDTFTAPVTGQYLLSVCVSVQDVTAAHTGRNLKIITSNRQYTNIT